MEQRIRIFFPDSYMRGLCEHSVIAGQRFVAEDITLPGWVICDANYAAFRRDPAGGIVRGEVWDVDDMTLLKLERRNCAPKVKQLQDVELMECGWVQAYVCVCPAFVTPVFEVPGGCWRAHIMRQRAELKLEADRVESLVNEEGGW